MSQDWIRDLPNYEWCQPKVSRRRDESGLGKALKCGIKLHGGAVGDKSPSQCIVHLPNAALSHIQVPGHSWMAGLVQLESIEPQGKRDQQEWKRRRRRGFCS